MEADLGAEAEVDLGAEDLVVEDFEEADSAVEWVVEDQVEVLSEELVPIE